MLTLLSKFTLVLSCCVAFTAVAQEVAPPQPPVRTQVNSSVITGPAIPGALREQLVVTRWSDGSLSFSHSIGEKPEYTYATEMLTILNVNSESLQLLRNIASRRNLVRHVVAVPAAACGALLASFATVSATMALLPSGESGLITLILAIYYGIPAAALTGAVVTYPTVLAIMRERKKQFQAVQLLAKAATTVQGKFESKMPIGELVGYLASLKMAVAK